MIAGQELRQLVVAWACLGLSGGCVGDAEPQAASAAADRAAYVAALQGGEPSACGRVEAEELRGDCVAAVLGRGSPRDPAVCEAVAPPGIWRQECWFVAADDPDAAYALRVERCGRAGPFETDCLRHQRLREAALLGGGEGVLQARVAAMGSIASQVEAAGAAELWRSFWQASHAAAGSVDHAVCAGLAAREGAACLAATRAVVEDRARQAAEQGLLSTCEPVELAAIPLGSGSTTLGPDPQVGSWARAASGGRCPDAAAGLGSE